MEKSIFILFQRLPMLSIKDVLKEAYNTPTSDSFVHSGDDVWISLIDHKAVLSQLPPLPTVEDNLDGIFLIRGVLV